MAREYTISSGGVTILGANTLIFLHNGTTCTLEVLRMWCGVVGPTTSAMQRIQIETQVTAFPTLTGATPQRLKEGDPISQIVSGTAGAAGTAGINASAEGAGAKTVKFEDTFNLLNGWLWVPTPKETIYLSPGSASGLGMFFPVAPGTLTNWSFGMNFCELG